MIAARAARHQAASVPAPRRSVLDTLLLRGMAWTDSHQGCMFAGAALVIIADCCLERLL